MSIAAIIGLAKAAASYWQYAVMGVLLIGLLWFKAAASDCKEGRAAAIIEAQKRADALSEKLITDQAAHKRELEAAVGSIRERIIRVPVTTACRDVPAMRNAIDGQLQLLGPRGSAP